MTNDALALEALNTATAAREAMQAVLDAAGEGAYGNMSRTRAVGRVVHGPRNVFASVTIAICGCNPARPSIDTAAERAALQAGAAVVKAAGYVVRQGR